MDHSAHSPAAHERAVQCIPWLVNGTLPADQTATLRAHLASCARCRSDYDSEKRLYEAIRADAPAAVASESSFAKLMARIEAPDDANPDGDRDTAEPPAAKPALTVTVTREPALTGKRRRSRRPWYASTAVRWVAAAVVLETLALGLVARMWHAPQPAEGAAYQTLTASAPRYGSGPRVRIVFKSSVTLEALQKLLRSVEAHIVDGPTDAQVYTLGFAQPVTSAELDARIATLRANAQVLFAELAPPDAASR